MLPGSLVKAVVILPFKTPYITAGHFVHFVVPLKVRVHVHVYIYVCVLPVSMCASASTFRFAGIQSGVRCGTRVRTLTLGILSLTG